MKNNLLPDMYAKNMFSINYDKLKNIGVKTLVFDLDNTIVERGNKIITPDLVALFEKLKKDFNCIVLSNTIKYNHIKAFCDAIGTEFIWFAMKPCLNGYKRAQKKHNSKNKEMCMIGDQYFTDVKGAKKLEFHTVLVDQIGPNDGIFTKINRIKERKFYQKINFKKGKYYD